VKACDHLAADSIARKHTITETRINTDRELIPEEHTHKRNEHNTQRYKNSWATAPMKEQGTTHSHTMRPNNCIFDVSPHHRDVVRQKFDGMLPTTVAGLILWGMAIAVPSPVRPFSIVRSEDDVIFSVSSNAVHVLDSADVLCGLPTALPRTELSLVRRPVCLCDVCFCELWSIGTSCLL
jgi:hypothetical protein